VNRVARTFLSASSKFFPDPGFELAGKSGGGPPQSKTLARRFCFVSKVFRTQKIGQRTP
jgi:hypothetical protein